MCGFQIKMLMYPLGEFQEILPNFETVTEHTTHLIVTQKTRPINFGAWISFVIFASHKTNLCPLLLFGSGQL